MTEGESKDKWEILPEELDLDLLKSVVEGQKEVQNLLERVIKRMEEREAKG